MNIFLLQPNNFSFSFVFSLIFNLISHCFIVSRLIIWLKASIKTLIKLDLCSNVSYDPFILNLLFVACWL